MGNAFTYQKKCSSNVCAKIAAALATYSWFRSHIMALLKVILLQELCFGVIYRSILTCTCVNYTCLKDMKAKQYHWGMVNHGP